MSDHMTKGGQLGQWVSSPKGQRLMADIAGAFAGGTQGQDSWQNRLANVAKEQAKGRSQTYMNQGVGQPQVQPSGVTVGGGVGTNQQSNTVQDSTNVGGLLAGGGLSGDVGFGQEKKKSPFPLGDSDTQSKNAGLSQEEIDNAIKENPTGDHTPAERSTDEMILDRLQNSQNTAFPVFNDVGGTLANSDFFTGKDVSQMLGGLTPEEQIAFNKSKQELRKGEQDITSAQQNDAYKQAMIDIYQKQGRKLVQRKDGAMVDQYTGEVITPPPALPEKVYSIAPGGKLVDAQGNEIALGQDKKITPKLTKKYEAMDPDGSGQIGHYWQDEQGNMEWKPDLLTTNERFKQQDKAIKNIDNSLSTSLEGMYTDGFVRSINPNTGQTEVSYSMTPSGNVARVHKTALMRENYLNKLSISRADPSSKRKVAAMANAQRAWYDEIAKNLFSDEMLIYGKDKPRQIVAQATKWVTRDEWHHIFGNKEAGEFLMSQVAQDPLVAVNLMAHMKRLGLNSSGIAQNIAIMKKAGHNNFHKWLKEMGFESVGGKQAPLAIDQYSTEISKYITEGVQTTAVSGKPKFYPPNPDAVNDLFGMLEYYAEANKFIRKQLKSGKVTMEDGTVLSLAAGKTQKLPEVMSELKSKNISGVGDVLRSGELMKDIKIGTRGRKVKKN